MLHLLLSSRLIDSSVFIRSHASSFPTSLLRVAMLIVFALAIGGWCDCARGLRE
jgi:hypothetical protein